MNIIPSRLFLLVKSTTGFRRRAALESVGSVQWKATWICATQWTSWSYRGSWTRRRMCPDACCCWKRGGNHLIWTISEVYISVRPIKGWIYTEEWKSLLREVKLWVHVGFIPALPSRLPIHLILSHNFKSHLDLPLHKMLFQIYSTQCFTYASVIRNLVIYCRDPKTRLIYSLSFVIVKLMTAKLYSHQGLPSHPVQWHRATSLWQTAERTASWSGLICVALHPTSPPSYPECTSLESWQEGLDYADPALLCL